MHKSFQGYLRPDGSAGTRNYVLVLPVNRTLNFIASNVTAMLNGCRYFEIPADGGRTENDRMTIARTMTGLINNPNVGGVLLLAVKPDFGYKNMSPDFFLDEVKKTGKPWCSVVLSECGGAYNMLGEALKVGRRLSCTVSEFRRELCDISKLRVAVKCGMSDATSGLAGNPTVGRMFDTVVSQGGTAFFSETTEIIGAEHILAKRAITTEVAQSLLNAAWRWEEKAKSTGEDIRKINPIPSNIAAGLTTLEEKSLGAIAKSGTSPISGVLKYGERPPGKGLYFVDAWMSSLSLPLCFAACGANIIMYQMGGGDMAEKYPMMPAINPTIVTPWMYLTGNKHTYDKAPDSIDFNSSSVLEGSASLEEMGSDLLDYIINIASGTFTKMEALNYQEQVEVLMEGPFL
ncbi:UxaA family hydrolase [Salmonella enterica]|uniref:UxaA family hydrolase n=1 Tax=Salmonella enterica TaxID=28901 RepID=UPI003D31F413